MFGFTSIKSKGRAVSPPTGSPPVPETEYDDQIPHETGDSGEHADVEDIVVAEHQVRDDDDDEAKREASLSEIEERVEEVVASNPKLVPEDVKRKEDRERHSLPVATDRPTSKRPIEDITRATRDEWRYGQHDYHGRHSQQTVWPGTQPDERIIERVVHVEKQISALRNIIQSGVPVEETVETARTVLHAPAAVGEIVEDVVEAVTDVVETVSESAQSTYTLVKKIASIVLIVVGIVSAAVYTPSSKSSAQVFI